MEIILPTLGSSSLGKRSGTLTIGNHTKQARYSYQQKSTRLLPSMNGSDPKKKKKTYKKWNKYKMSKKSKALSRIMKPEVKKYFGEVDFTTITTGYTQTVGLVKNIQVGSNSNQRIGNKIQVIGIRIRGSFQQPIRLDTGYKWAPRNLRFQLFQWINSNGATPSWAAFYQAMGHSDAFLVNRDKTTSKAKSLLDIEMDLDGIEGEIMKFDHYVNCSFFVQYIASNGVDADVNSNNVVIALSGSKHSETGNTYLGVNPVINYGYTIYYLDL